MTKKTIKIYLCGSIKKGEKDNSKSFYWGSDEEAEILKSFGPEWEIALVNPATIELKRVDSFANFGGDMHLVKNSDIVFVDARDKKGIGIGAEMFAAKYFLKPVICLLPKGSHYRRDFIENLCGENVQNWVHPFITGLSDFVAETIPEAVGWMKRLHKEPSQIKGMEVVEEAINYFVEKQGR
jgi:hypothetical protein